MRATASALIVGAALLLSGACGEGRAIFNVDVLSFIQPSGKDTIRYNLATALAVSADSFITPQKVSLPPGLGKSSVDSVSVTAAAVIENTTGTGSLQFQVYFAKDSANVYTTTPYITANGTISGTQPSTVPLLPPTSVALSDSVFNTDVLWVGVHAGISKNAGADLVGRVRLTTLSLRVVLKDKIF
jgi:hypothetical protein